MYSGLGGIYSLTGVLLFTFSGWCFWEGVFYLISLIPIHITFGA